LAEKITRVEHTSASPGTANIKNFCRRKTLPLADLCRIEIRAFWSMARSRANFAAPPGWLSDFWDQLMLLVWLEIMALALLRFFTAPTEARGPTDRFVSVGASYRLRGGPNL
jgi:hypothetical protein